MGERPKAAKNTSRGRARTPVTDSTEDQAQGILLANRWLKAAVSLLGTDAGCVIVTEGGLSRIIARCNIPHAFMMSESTLHSAPYGLDGAVVLRDATGQPELHAFLGAIARPRTGFFYRRPLSINADRVISMLLFGETALPHLADRELGIIEEIAVALAAEMDRYYPSGATKVATSLRMTRQDLDRWLDGTDLAAAIFSRDLVLEAVNAPMRAALPVPWDRMIGRPLSTLDLPGHASIAFLFRHAINSGISTPRLDMTLEDSAGEGLPQMLRVVGSPMSPIGGDTVLIATFDPHCMADSPRRIVDGLGRHGGEPSVDFLLETLVRRRSLRSRKDISYVTLRSWRQPIREHQISAMKAIKRAAPDRIAAEIAAEMADDVKSLFGVGSFKAVVPVPCGHSPEGLCLSVAISQALARDLGLPVAHALVMAPDKGSSHPKRNTERAAMSLATPVEGPVLLVDDVATSGQHIAEATGLLRSSGASALAMSWIGGDAT